MTDERIQEIVERLEELGMPVSTEEKDGREYWTFTPNLTNRKTGPVYANTLRELVEKALIYYPKELDTPS